MAWTDEFGLDIDDLTDAPPHDTGDTVPGAGIALALGAMTVTVIVAVTALIVPASQRAQLTDYALAPRWPTADIVRGPQRVAVASPAQPRKGFAVSFGGFPQREVAEIQARLVRSKGYIARVWPQRSGFQVLSRDYGRQERAAFWTRIFAEIGIDGRVVAVRHGAGGEMTE